MTFGEKLELAFDSASKEAKIIGLSPVTVAKVCVEGVFVEITKSVSHPWFWKLQFSNGTVKVLKDEWDLCYVEA